MVPPTRIHYTDRLDDLTLPGAMQVTITLTPASCGTEPNLTPEGVPDRIPAEGC